MSFKPAFTCTTRRVTGPGATPPLNILYAGEPCACWFSSGRSRSRVPGDPPIVAAVCLQLSRYFDPPGWSGNPPTFDITKADYFQLQTPTTLIPKLSVVYSGLMWVGTPDVHVRFDCTPFRNLPVASSVLQSWGPQAENGNYLPGGRYATFDIYRPFGAAVPFLAAVPGVIYPDPYGGRNRPTGQQGLYWSDVLDTADTVDIRDGVLRNAGTDSTTYADGDEVRFPTGVAVTRYVVIKVTRVGLPDGTVRKRVYLVRDNPIWPGP